MGVDTRTTGDHIFNHKQFAISLTKRLDEMDYIEPPPLKKPGKK
jgi:hypothetical protein